MAELTWRNKHEPGQATQEDGTEAHYEWLLQAEHRPDNNIAPNDHWTNHLLWGDKKGVLAALLPTFASSIHLIYVDPPFMTGKTFNSGPHLAYKDLWNNDLDSYLQWLYETFLQLHTLLTPTGSLYIHLDWRATHYAKLLLDEIFRKHATDMGAGFKNEIIWHYQSGGRSQKHYARKHDTILLYTKSSQYCFHSERVGERRGAQKRNHMRKEVGQDGKVTWSIRSAGRIYTYDEDTLMALSDVWSDISHLHQKDPERTGYATQKPEALLERIILASSEEDDLVLDCFCGSGVTPLVAERTGRRWIAGDKSELAITTTSQRLQTAGLQRPFRIQQLIVKE
ncbi:site-specific DNA-methyltransferase [Reticulibacter mediterranei]|uniref:Site-specific DNA-methyltransferase n=1 Tax=Reticulibacter mediterranei TaxID=2778369 RepID=A0A8J3IKF1_9CHLR|nr:site-specific DNA-methyltransferase [Reticulibacter mediterranei]GHO96116.1 site-specific DNA-methyltransferase [Reticulibacter mediterranei]